MSTYILRRVVQMGPVLVFVSLVSFTLIFILPGDPALALLGEERARDQAAYQQLRRELGLDRPVPVQYAAWAGRVLRGDLGTSTKTQLPVVRLLLQRLAPTLQLTAMAMVFALVIALPIGILSAVRPNSGPDVAGTVGAMAGASIPNFWLGLLLILLFALGLRWLPPSGYVPFAQNPIENIRLMVLPTITLGGGIAALVMRQVRSAMLEVLHQDFITTARSKGLPPRMVILRHALKNALIPVATVVGLQTGHLMGGAVITETIFSIPGIGSLAASSIFTRDFPTLQAVILLMALAVLIANLTTDIVYAWLDPRIRYGR